MKRFYDYVCENGHKTEKFVVYEATNLKCECGALATRSLHKQLCRVESPITDNGRKKETYVD